MTVLVGGFPACENEDFLTESRGVTTYAMGGFSVTLDDNAVKDFDFVKENIDNTK